MVYALSSLLRVKPIKKTVQSIGYPLVHRNKVNALGCKIDGGPALFPIEVFIPIELQENI